jgi:hypothetical protein
MLFCSVDIHRKLPFFTTFTHVIMTDYRLFFVLCSFLQQAFSTLQKNYLVNYYKHTVKLAVTQLYLLEF